MAKAPLLALLLALGACAPVPAAPPTTATPLSGCAMNADDRAWLEGALANWAEAEREVLHLPPAPLPQVVAIDAACTYTMQQGRVGDAVGVPHDGEAVALGEQALPIGPIAFADGSGRFVMSLPSVWRASGVTSRVDFGTFLEGVMLHEIMHTRQAELAHAALEEIEARADIEVSDDAIQGLFEGDPEYVVAYQRERDLLFAAAKAPDTASARRLAREALAAMESRRARYFTGNRAYLADMEDVFLTMEGMGQYLMYRHLARQPGITPEQAFAEANRAKYWTQNEGLALFLALDRLLPDWPARSFREPDWRAQNLLAAAAGEIE